MRYDVLDGIGNPQPGTIWNRLRPEVVETILVVARAEPDRSAREIACWISDHAGFSVSESSVYRVLKQHGLVREVQLVGFPAGAEYAVKDHAGRAALHRYRIRGIPADGRIRHIRCSPHHPQTNRKLERFHETLKGRMNLLVWANPEELRTAIAEFIEFYDQRRYLEGIGNVAPADVNYGRPEEILRRREVQKQQTFYDRFEYNRTKRSKQRLCLAAHNTTNASVAPSATTNTKTGEPNNSDWR